MIQNNILVSNNNSDSNSLRFFSSLCETNSILQPSWGTGPGTFSRASAQYITDFEGETRKIESNCVAIEGSRVVTNLLTYSEDLSNAAWIASGATKNGNILTINNLNDRVYQAVTLSSGVPFRVTVSFSSGDVGKVFRFFYYRDADVYSANYTVPTSGRVSFTATPSSAVTYVGFASASSVAEAYTLTLVNLQLENVTGQTNQNPGEYVRTTSSALSQCFSTTNGNTVDASGVVTEVIGTSLPQSYPERVNTNTYGLNDRIQVAGWWYQCTTLGISAGSAPTFPQGKAGTQTVTDGSVVWTIGGRLLLGYVSEPASTNKTTAYGIIPADTLGSELVTVAADREFSSDTGWWTKNGSTISDGTCNYSAITATAPYRSALATEGKVYQVTYTVTSVTSGSIVGRVGGVNGLTPRTTPGTYTDTILAGASSNAIGLAANNFTGSIDNVSIKEVGWAVGTKSFYNGSSFVQNITGLTLSGGDTAAVLSIVTDQTEIEKAGLAGINPGYKVYKLDNSAGATSSVVAVTGTVGNTNKHSISIVARASAGTFRMIDASGTWGYVTTTLVPYTRIKTVDKTPASTLDYLLLSATAGTVAYFLLPQLEELPYATSIIPPSGATATRAATSLSYPTAGNLRGNAVTVGVEGWSSVGLQVARIMQVDDNGRFVYLNNGSFTAYDGVTSGSIGPAPSANTRYKIITRCANSFARGFTNGTAYTAFNFDGSMGSGSTFYIGSSGATEYYFGYLRNLKIWFKPLSDDRCKQLTL